MFLLALIPEYLLALHLLFYSFFLLIFLFWWTQYRMIMFFVLIILVHILLYIILFWLFLSIDISAERILCQFTHLWCLIIWFDWYLTLKRLFATAYFLFLERLANILHWDWTFRRWMHCINWIVLSIWTVYHWIWNCWSISQRPPSLHFIYQSSHLFNWCLILQLQFSPIFPLRLQHTNPLIQLLLISFFFMIIFIS